MIELEEQGGELHNTGTSGYKILILHAVRGDARKTTLDHIYGYPIYATGNLYAYHHAMAPVSPELMSFPFDAVIMNYCFLAQRESDLFPDLLKTYSFLLD